MESSNLSKDKRLCECGCGTLIPATNSRNKPARFAKGHNVIVKHGSEHPSWRGGKAFLGSKYTMVWVNGEYILEHRYVYEQYYRCCILPSAVVHHKNGNPSDNRIDNLQGMTRAQHNTIHDPFKGHRKTDNPRDPITGRFYSSKNSDSAKASLHLHDG